jgi:hypothetical protein
MQPEQEVYVVAYTPDDPGTVTPYNRIIGVWIMPRSAAPAFWAEMYEKLRAEGTWRPYAIFLLREPDSFLRESGERP